MVPLFEHLNCYGDYLAFEFTMVFTYFSPTSSNEICICGLSLVPLQNLDLVILGQRLLDLTNAKKISLSNL